MRCFVPAVLLFAASLSSASIAQNTQPLDTFSRKNTFTLFAEYSNTSSHILMGASRQRKLADFGAGYTRRIIRFWGSDLGYHVEVRPVLFESDPVSLINTVYTVTSPPATLTLNQTLAPPGICIASHEVLPFGPNETASVTTTCGRQWTAGQAFAPIGFKYSMRTHHPLQPYAIGTLGYMYTSRPVPISTAESFNFVFDFGAGIELFHSSTHKSSISIETRFHHFSNRDTAQSNPGADNIVYNLSYSFGR